MPARPIVLDANILIRFVLGDKVPALLAAHAAAIDFLAPIPPSRKPASTCPRFFARGGTTARARPPRWTNSRP